jgi:hypothetical protein
MIAAGSAPLASTPLLQGWSARMVAGVGSRFESGATVSVGADYQTWTVKAKAQVPFAAR